MSRPDDFRTIAKAALKGFREDESSHPASEEWVAYVRGELAASSTERMRRHLSLCPRCTQLILDIADLRNIDFSSDEPGTSRDLDHAWRSLETRLEARRPSKSPTRWSGEQYDLRPRRLPWILAAGFFAVALGLSIWLIALREEVVELREPRADLWVVDLRPVAEGTIRGSEAEETLSVPEEASQLVVILGVPDVRPYRDYRVEVRDSEERVLWSRRGLTRTPEGSLILAFPLHFLPGGEGRIQLFGHAGKEERRLARYRFRIERPPG